MKTIVIINSKRVVFIKLSENFPWKKTSIVANFGYSSKKLLSLKETIIGTKREIENASRTVLKEINPEK